MKNLLKSKAGFTIIEVVLSSITLVVSLLGGVVFLSANRNNLSYASLQRLATWGAVYKIEQLKSMDYSALPVSGTENLTISGKSFTRKTTITDISGNYKQATVEMGWVQDKFPVSLTTYISDK